MRSPEDQAAVAAAGPPAAGAACRWQPSPPATSQSCCKRQPLGSGLRAIPSPLAHRKPRTQRAGGGCRRGETWPRLQGRAREGLRAERYAWAEAAFSRLHKVSHLSRPPARILSPHSRHRMREHCLWAALQRQQALGGRVPAALPPCGWVPLLHSCLFHSSGSPNPRTEAFED